MALFAGWSGRCNIGSGDEVMARLYRRNRFRVCQYAGDTSTPFSALSWLEFDHLTVATCCIQGEADQHSGMMPITSSHLAGLCTMFAQTQRGVPFGCLADHIWSIGELVGLLKQKMQGVAA
jgi:hypothetical protein